MDPARHGSICWRFLNGSCRFGSRCNYRHERPSLPSPQICRYFQKGVCWYGERCRYLHALQPDVDTAAAGRRGSVPTVSSSSVSHVSPDRRGSEPALRQAEETSSLEMPVDGAVAAVAAAAAAVAVAVAPGSHEAEGFLRSRNVTCGICMDKVYEKSDTRKQVFGILPNCNHSFCLECIMSWRKTKDLGPDVVKTCPQCRVRSAFYVPNKYWVEGQEKETVIASFKEKFSNRMCSYYARYRPCPFRTECLYRHDKHARRRSFPYPTEDEDDDGVDLLNFFIAMTLLGGDEDDDHGNDDDDFVTFYLTEAFGF
ncbi:makorin, ring finger protein, 4 [Embiotoca jacksoni]|uniref:makorin, ring finger protein, 4 n=1 Tax=Embiotoca jacksoni TaxID=100190 RepID=UPI003703C058